MFHASFNRPHAELRYSLVITFPDGEVHSFPVGDAAITIGRSPATAIRVPEDGVSRQHCVISPAGGRLVVLDQGSTNGTFVNGALVRQARLNDGDVVQVGSTRIRVLSRPAQDDEPSGRPTQPVETYEETDLTTTTFEIPIGTADVVQRLAERLAASDGAVSAAELVLDAVTEVLPVDRAFIITRRRDRRGLSAEVLASRSKLPNEDATGELDVEIPDRVLETLVSGPHIVTAAESTSAVRAALRDRTSGPVLCAPLRQGGEVFGALYLDALTLPEWAQNDDMLGFLSSVGGLTALAIGRARLQAELNVELRLSNRQREQLSSLDRSEDSGEHRRRDVLPLSHRRLPAATALGLLRDIGPAGEELERLLGTLRLALDEGSDQARTLDRASLVLQRALSAVTDLTTLVALEDGSHRVAPRSIDGLEMLERVVRLFEPDANARGATLSLGAIEEGLELRADPEMMPRVLGRLVADALEQVERGGRVVLSARSRVASIELVVADTGCGVSGERVEAYFSPSAADGEGRGGSAALYFCRLAVEAQGGTIHVTGPSGNNRVVVTVPSIEPSFGPKRESEVM